MSDTSIDLPTAYDAKGHEQDVYERWEALAVLPLVLANVMANQATQSRFHRQTLPACCTWATPSTTPCKIR